MIGSTVLFTSVSMFLSTVSIQKLIPIKCFFSGQPMTLGCRRERVGAMSQFISNTVLYHVYMENHVCFYDSW